MLTKIGLHIRVFAFTMASLLMVSSVGIAINIHYCKGEADSIGIYKVAEKCNMCLEHDAILTSTDLEILSKASCCDEDAVYNKLSPNVPIVNAKEIVADLFDFNYPRNRGALLVYVITEEYPELQIPIPDNRQSVLQVYLI